MDFKTATLNKARQHYTISMYVEPTAKGRPRAGKNNRVYTPKKTRDAEAEMSQCIAKFIADEGIIPFEKGKPLRVNIRTLSKRPKRLGLGDCEAKTTRPDIADYLKPTVTFEVHPL